MAHQRERNSATALCNRWRASTSSTSAAPRARIRKPTLLAAAEATASPRPRTSVRDTWAPSHGATPERAGVNVRFRLPHSGRCDPMSSLAIRIVLAEDDYLVREGVRKLLETRPDLEVIASCGDLATPRSSSRSWPPALGGRNRRSRQLTPREREVLEQMARGKNNAATAAALVITQQSVEKYIHSIFQKLGLTWGRRPPRVGGASLSVRAAPRGLNERQASSQDARPEVLFVDVRRPRRRCERLAGRSASP